MRGKSTYSNMGVQAKRLANEVVRLVRGFGFETRHP